MEVSISDNIWQRQPTLMIKIRHQAANNSEILKRTCDILQKGGIIVYPTDTIYGLGCDIFHEESLKKIVKLKGRKSHHACSIICPDIIEVRKYAILSDSDLSIIKRYMPGAFTFILKSSSKTPKEIRSQKDTVGIRIPDNKISLDLTRKLGRPIISTSVNRTGEQPLCEPEIIAKLFGGEIDLMIDAGRLTSLPSTVVDLTHDTPVVLREGKGKFL